jgi:hypothetical protein
MRRPVRERRSAPLGAALLALLVWAPFAPAAVARHHPPHRRPAMPAVLISVDRSRPGRAVPSDFLGLSFEVSNLQQIAAYAHTGDLVTMLRSLGPGELRFGGGSADTRVAWTDDVTPRPAWASSVVDADDLRQLGALAASSGWHIVLTLNLGHYEPEAAAREALAAKAALGGWLEGIELGNEPNAFAQHGLRPEPWTFTQYDAEVSAYRSAIEAAAPGIPLMGPDVSGSAAFESWGLGEAIDQRPAELTGHHYPLGCEQKPAPSIARLLSPLIRRKEVGSLQRYMAISRQSGIPFRLDETNSVSCGGTSGISDTFASALWASGYLAQVMSMGVAGINLHGNPANCNGYAPLCAPTPDGLANGELIAQPEWYALLLAKQLLGDRPLATIVHRRGAHDLSVSALLAANGSLQCLVVDDDPPGAQPLSVGVGAGAGFLNASILSLTAPSPESLTGIELGGQTVAPDGSWSPARLPVAANRHGLITVQVQPSSAVLLTAPATP